MRQVIAHRERGWKQHNRALQHIWDVYEEIAPLIRKQNKKEKTYQRFDFIYLRKKIKKNKRIYEIPKCTDDR